MVIPGAPDGGLPDSNDDGSDGDGALTPADRELERAAEEQDDEQSTSSGGRGSTGLTSGGGETVTGTDDDGGGGGIDAGEPISGVDGQGSPRDDSVSTPVEGSGGTDGMGGGIDRFVPDDTAGGDTTSGGGETVSGGTDVAEDATDGTASTGPSAGDGIDQFVPDDPTVSDPTDDETVSGGTDVAEGATSGGGALTPADRELERAAEELARDREGVRPTGLRGGSVDRDRAGGGGPGPLDRGSPASEAARDIAAHALAYGFQNPEELNTGIDIERRAGDVSLSGPGLVSLDPTAGPILREGDPGTLNRDIVDSLTAGRGLFGEGTRELDQPEFRTPDVGDGSDGVTDPAVLERQIADANPGIDPEDVVVQQSETEFVGPGGQGIAGSQTGFSASIDLTVEEQRERIAAANEGVSASDVSFQREDGEVVAVTGTDEGGFFTPTEFELSQRIQDRQETFGVGDEAAAATPDVGIYRGVTTRDVARGVGRVPGDAAAALPAVLLGADAATQVGANLPETVEEFGAASTAQTVAEVGGRTTGQAVDVIEERPGEVSGALAGGFVGGAAAGRAIGITGRAIRDRRRTFGGEELDFEDVTQEDVVDYTRTAGDEGAPFPGFDDEDLAQQSQREAIEQQAAEMTPDELAARLDETGYTEGSDLFKTLDEEPAGPGTATVGDRVPGVTERRVTRSGGGFEAPDVGTAEAEAYETSGTSFSPELSPYFLQSGTSRSRFSLRPGFPDLGGRPTAVAARMDIRDTDAADRAEFEQELLEAQGDSVGYTLPPDEFSLREAEVITPPGATFQDVGGSRLRQALRRAGVGSDFYVTIPDRTVYDLPGGRSVRSPAGATIDIPFSSRSVTLPGGSRRVPVRPVIPDGAGDDIAAGAGDVAADVDNQVYAGVSRSDIERELRPSTDRPLPTFSTGGETTTTSVRDGRDTETLRRAFDADGGSSYGVFRSRDDGSRGAGAGSTSGSSAASSGTSRFIGSSGGSSGGGGGSSGSSFFAGSSGGTSGGSSGGGGGGSGSGFGGGGGGIQFLPDTPSAPPVGGFLGGGDNRKEENRFAFMGESQQFTVPIADPEDVVDVGGDFGLGLSGESDSSFGI